jgi:hypothetical protein
MSDLISRKALLEDMRNTITESSDTLDWINLINKQPIAYDVDKVVEQVHEYFNGFHENGLSEDDKTLFWMMEEYVVKLLKGGGRV